MLIFSPQAVADIIRTTLGPRSMLKMLLDAGGGMPKACSYLWCCNAKHFTELKKAMPDMFAGIFSLKRRWDLRPPPRYSSETVPLYLPLKIAASIMCIVPVLLYTSYNLVIFSCGWVGHLGGYNIWGKLCLYNKKVSIQPHACTGDPKT